MHSTGKMFKFGLSESLSSYSVWILFLVRVCHLFLRVVSSDLKPSKGKLLQLTAQAPVTSADFCQHSPDMDVLDLT